MKKFILFSILFLNSAFLFSQEKNTIPEKHIQNGFAALDYISIEMPNDWLGNPEVNMGLMGLHYNLWFSKYAYTGLGFYGSVTGNRGGLFTLGFNLGIKTPLTEKMFLDAGFHFGGGGGASAPDGGGAFILPHVNIGYQFEKLSATIGYSYINFFDKGNINNKQIRLGIQIPLSFDYASFSEKENSFSVDELKNSNWNTSSKKYSLMMHVNNLSPYGNSKLTDGISSLSGKTIRLAGFEFDAYIKNNWFAFFKADGAFHGIQGGYMDIFIGAGYHLSFNKNRTNILTKFGVGAGGGGGADTAGGFLIYPDISIEQKLFNEVYFSVNKGYLMNPNQHFTSSTIGFGLKYYVHQQGIETNYNNTFSNGKFKGIEVIVGQEMYIEAVRMLYPTENLHQIALQINLFINHNFYVAGHTSFANFGNAGAYAEGIVGLGYQTKPLLNNKIQLFSQLLAGAAGGGDISTGQGLVLKPSVGFNYILNDKLSLRSSIGRIKARGGNLNSTSFTFGINYRLSFLTAN